MSNPYLIGLTGKRGAGKSTVGEIIKDWVREELGQEAQLQGFADSLKLSFARIFVPNATLDQALRFADSMKNNGSLFFSTPLMDHDLFEAFGANRSISGRTALQHYGTEAHRHVFADNFWVDQLLPFNSVTESGETTRWEHQWKAGIGFAVITDLRFPNEAQRVNDLGGMIFRVNRPELDKQEDAHASEIPLEESYIFDTFENEGSLIDLRTEVYQMMDYHFGSDGEPNIGFAPAGSELAIGIAA